MNTTIPKPFSDRPLWEAAKPFSKPEDATLKEHFLDETDGMDDR